MPNLDVPSRDDATSGGGLGFDEATTGNGLGLDETFLRRLERLALGTRRVAGLVGGRPGRRLTPAADFVDHRPYTPGDDQRHIDWPAVARHDEVFVKVGRVPQAAHVHLAIDTSLSMATPPAKRRLAVQVAAALGWLSLAHGDRVSARPFPGAASGWGPASGGGRGAALLAYLASLGADASGTTDLAPALAAAGRVSGAGGLAVVLSDLWLDDLDLALGRLPSSRWDLLVLQILDPAELDPPAYGAVELVDAESGERLEISVDDDVRAAVRRAVSGRVELAAAAVASRGGVHALVPADWPIERAVLPFLERRSVLRA